jgi:hypothetical protein
LFLPGCWGFELSSSKTSPSLNKIITILILGGGIFVLLSSLIACVLPAFEEPFEEDDTSFLELGMMRGFAKDLFSASPSFGFILGRGSEILRLDYLKSHIGGKQFVDSHIQFNNSFFLVLFCVAALFLVPSFLYSVQMPSQRNRSYQVFAGDRPMDFAQRKLFNSRRFVYMQGSLQSGVYQEKLLIQGGL